MELRARLSRLPAPIVLPIPPAAPACPAPPLTSSHRSSSGSGSAARGALAPTENAGGALLAAAPSNDELDESGSVELLRGGGQLVLHIAQRVARGWLSKLHAEQDHTLGCFVLHTAQRVARGWLSKLHAEQDRTVPVSRDA